MHPIKTSYNRPQRELDNESSNNWFQTTEIFLDDSMHIFQTAGTPSLGYKYENHILVSFFKKEYSVLSMKTVAFFLMYASIPNA